MKTDQQRQPHWPQMWCIEDPRGVFVCYLMILPKAVWRWPFSTLEQTRIREMFVSHRNILVRKIVTCMTQSVCILQSFKERRFWGRRGNRISLSIQINPTAWLAGLLFGVHCMERGPNQQTWRTCSSLFILQMEKKAKGTGVYLAFSYFLLT